MSATEKIIHMIEFYYSIIESDWWTIILYWPFLWSVGVLSLARQLKFGRMMMVDKHMKWSRVVVDGKEWTMIEWTGDEDKEDD